MTDEISKFYLAAKCKQQNADELYIAEKFLEQILFSDKDQAIQIAKYYSTLKHYHARKYYCHHAQTQTTYQLYLSKKNNCTRNTGFNRLLGLTYCKNKRTKYYGYQYIMLENSNLMPIGNYQIDKKLTYWRLTLKGEQLYDNQMKCPCHNDIKNDDPQKLIQELNYQTLSQYQQIIISYISQIASCYLSW
ncbi:Hypothetical_protein [Hexamita inflata]|uniref:Hypothetical_protein n=1 Tax=Hexamita inflata TaxID=28002 RepID=A0AA86U5T1_9EUKA|nr:Hypothetical protein HINF_LOCUS26582 [Hexamita inflata]